MADKYGQFGQGTTTTCCYSGMMDLYCNSLEPGNLSSNLCFTRTCSVNTEKFPYNGALLDQVWSVRWGGAYPWRGVELSKAAWQNNLVFQLEMTGGAASSSGATPRSFQPDWDRYPADNPVAPLQLEYPSVDVQPGPPDLQLTRWVTHSGAFNDVASVSQEGDTRRMELTPLFGIVSTEAESIASFGTVLTDGTVNCSFRISTDFRSCGVLARVKGKRDFVRARLQKEPYQKFILEEVVAGAVTVLAENVIAEPRAFTPDNYNADSNEYITGFIMPESEAIKYISLTVNGASVKATLRVQIRNYGTSNNEDVDMTLVGTTTILEGDSYGIYAETVDVAAGPIAAEPIDAGATGRGTTKLFISIYDDSVPEQVAEFDVTADFEPILTDFYTDGDTNYRYGFIQNAAGTLVAGGEKGLWIHNDLRSKRDSPFTGVTSDPTRGGEIVGSNQCCYAANIILQEDELGDLYAVAPPVREFVNSGGWAFNDYTPYEQRTTRNKYASGPETFDAYQFQLAYKALPTFAQHSYPLACGWRMAGIVFNQISSDPDPRVYDIMVTHEFLAGDVVWPNDRSMPYVDESPPNIIFSYTETLTNQALGGSDDPTEDYLRYWLTMFHNTSDSTINDMSLSLDISGDYPVLLFEADPDLDGFVIGWNNMHYHRLGDRLGIAKIQIDATPEYDFALFNYNGPTGMYGSAVVAPGGKIAISRPVWDMGHDPMTDPVDTFRLSLILSDGSATHFNSSPDPADWPPKVSIAGGIRLSWSLYACSDRYVYAAGIPVSQIEADEWAGHSLPYIDRHSGSANWFPGLSWLISWDGETRVPCIGKLAFEPEYRSKEVNAGFGFFRTEDSFVSSRVTQRYDCIKDSTLPLAPDFALTAEGTVPFLHVFDDYPLYFDLSFYPDTGDSHAYEPKGLGLTSWTCPAGCTEVVVEAWGGGGGGASGMNPEQIST